MSIDVWIAVVTTLVGCYLAACHAALKTFSRRRLSDLLEERGKLRRLVRSGEHIPQLTLITGFLRTMSSLVVFVAILHKTQAQLGDQWSDLQVYLVSLVITAAVVGLFVVAIPTSWASYQREHLLAWSLPILHVLRLIIWPIAAAMHMVDPVIRRISGVDLIDEEDRDRISEEVLAAVEDHDEGATVDEAQKEMLEAVFDLPNTSAGEIMTPRTDIEGIDVNATLEQVRHAIMDAGHSRVPVYEESLDKIVGILYAKDLIKHVGNGHDFNLRALLREPFMVPESKKVSDLLAEFKARKVHIAIVLDEYGGTAGLVTIEDILEEIVGEIQDEYETAEDAPPVIQTIDDATAEVEARVAIDDVNDELDIELPEDEDYDTLGGFVFSQLGHIPEVGESFEFEGILFTVTDAERTKVNRVRIERQVAEEKVKVNGGAE